MKTNDDGYIVMHTGPMVTAMTPEEETDIVKLHGTKPYIMRYDEFEKGHKSIGAMSRYQYTSYVFCMKWKPEEECTIDFQIQLSDFDTATNDTKRKVIMCSKYSEDSELNLFTVLDALSNQNVRNNAVLSPFSQMNKNRSFQPAEQYEYELQTSVVDGVLLPCDPNSGHIFTQKKELIQHNDIVEMQYIKSNQEWVPLRLRSDKTEPNKYSVALANWKNIFNPVPHPTKWTRPEQTTTYYDASVLQAYYTMKKQSSGFSQLDSIHLLMKQYLILKVSHILANVDTSSKLNVYEVGCGKGTDLFHWNYVHENIRSLSFFLGTDYDANGLVRHDGAYYRYLQGGNAHQRVQHLEHKYDFDALFMQCNARASLEDCRDNNWENTDHQLERVSNHKLHYQMLRHVLFGKTPNENALRNALPDRFVHPTYNIISCQMAMHYFADNRSSFWKNVNMLLSRNGIFIATVPNGDYIQQKIQQSPNGKYTVHIQDSKQPSKRIPWYTYEESATKNKVFFQTPKINRSEEPLFLQKQALTMIRRYFHVLYFDTFGAFAQQNQMTIYQTSGDPFHKNSIQPQTLQHDFSNAHHKYARPVNDTKEALEYSQEGHYVVILCKKSGYNTKEVENIQQQLQ